ncbi:MULTISPECIES: tetratricopeptide repeat protein [unclassified Synechococcus]|uniref:tetratricopeptide repeat protein n=1 Tax=unclassified Synechococcus TaxID=2626047 RepID=UPI0039C4D5CC
MVVNKQQPGHPAIPLSLRAVGCLLSWAMAMPAHAQPPMTLLTGEPTVAQLKEDGARYLQMGFHTLAVNAYRSAIELEEKTLVLPSERDPDVPFNLGLIYARQGKLAEARAAFQRSVEVDPSSFKARYQLALVDLKLGNLVAAKEQLTLLAQAASNNPETHRHLQSLLAPLESVPLPGQPPARPPAVESEAAQLLPEPQKTETATLPTATETQFPEKEKPRSALQRLRQRELD